MRVIRWFLLLMVSVACRNEIREFTIDSPDSNILVTVEAGRKLSYSVKYKDTILIRPSQISLHLGNGLIIGHKPEIANTSTRQINDTIIPVVKEKRAIIPDIFNELTLQLQDGFELHFRVYNDGMAYRFASTTNDSLIVLNERASFNVQEGTTLYYSQVAQRDNADIFHTSFEEPYTIRQVDSLEADMLAFSPVLMKKDGLPGILITESDINDYPGMFFTKSDDIGLVSRFAPYPLKEKITGDEFRQKVVTHRASYISKTSGPRTFPWRVIVIAPKDSDLPVNDLVYRLAPEPEFLDFSWIKPGISTEEWITGLNLYNVDFKAGLNTATYKYYVDFAESFGFDYVMLDAGWSDVNDLFKVNPQMDMEEITRYATEKGIGLILWTQALTLERQMEKAIEQFKKWNIKIIMTDFIDRDDQQAIEFLHQFAKKCADNKFMCMIHGAPKPAGFTRTYPHMLAREGVLGSEYNIWSAKANPEHDLQLPFIRMVAGPMDYEPGLLQNVGSDHSEKLGFQKVIAQGTRIHQMAMFVIYESPLQLFSGNLSDAQRETELMQFLGRIPTVWDETHIIDARFADYIVEARRNGNTWYLAAMNDWTPCDFEIMLDFLPPGSYNIEIAADGINADRNPEDYRIVRNTVKSGDKLNIHLAPGGGYVAIITIISG